LFVHVVLRATIFCTENRLALAEAREEGDETTCEGKRQDDRDAAGHED
jgi:hypothetical protein